MERTSLTGAMLIDDSGAPPAAGRAVVVENGRMAHGRLIVNQT